MRRPRRKKNDALGWVLIGLTFVGLSSLALAGAMIEVVADRCVAVMREFAGRLAVPLVPAGCVMEHHHAGEWARP